MGQGGTVNNLKIKNDDKYGKPMRYLLQNYITFKNYYNIFEDKKDTCIDQNLFEYFTNQYSR